MSERRQNAKSWLGFIEGTVGGPVVSPLRWAVGDFQGRLLPLYEKASSVRVNWAKSGALLLGQWRDQAVATLPEGGREGLELLGVFWGTEGFKLKNWEGMKEKVYTQLSQWNWFLPQLTCGGGFWLIILITNNFVSSTLWHKLIVLTPPKGLI